MYTTLYKHTRSTVVIKDAEIYTSDFEQDFGRLKEYIDELIALYGPNAYPEYGQHHRYDDSYTYVIRRLETDEEFAARCIMLDKQVKKQESLERAEYERLHEKYGSSIE